MLKRVFAIAALAVIGCGTAAFADRVELVNGDVLTGKVTGSDGKQLTVKTDKAGEVKINLSDVKTFSTDEPLDIRLQDGTVANKKAVASDPGTIKVEAGDAPAANFRLDRVKAINPPPVAWHGSVKAGAMLSRGNTRTDSYVAGFDLNRRSENDRFTSTGQYNLSRERDDATGDINTSADNWEVNGKFDHFWTPKWYGFVATKVGKDRIQDLNLRFIPSVGVGYQWWEGPESNFNTEAGIAWVYEDYDGQETKEDFSLRLAYHYDRKLSDRMSMFHNFEILPSLEDIKSFLAKTDIGVRVDMTKKMFLEGKVELTHNSEPAPGNDRNDVKYILALGWKF